MRQRIDGSLHALRLDEAERLVFVNGGRIVTSIKNPKITHIIMDDEDSGRYAELIRKTAE